MSRLAFVVLMLPVAAWAQPPAGVNTVALDGHNFTVPEGFTIEQAAGPPLIKLPIVADFDERGRLYVAEAAGAISKDKIQAQKKPHRVVRLVDSDGDGKYD